MTEYLVRAKMKPGGKAELEELLQGTAIDEMKPFGAALAASLRAARDDGETAVWEETCHCSSPLKAERAAVLDEYFDRIETETVEAGEGWKRIRPLPRLFGSARETP